MNARMLGTASVVLNVGMLVLAGVVFRTRPAPDFSPLPPNASDEPAASRPKEHRASAPPPPVKAITWSDIESPDYKVYMARLRAIGCPEVTIREVIVARVNRNCAQKRGAIRRGGEEFVYWRPDRGYESQPDYYPKLRLERAAMQERHALLVDLLGVDPNEELRRESGTYDYLEWQYDFLAGDKRDRARDLQESYLDLQRELYPTNRSSPAVRRQLRELFQKRLAELATFLTPQELEEYNLRSSHAAEAVRHLLDGFEPTATEFKEIFYLRQKRDAALALLDPGDPDAVAAYQQARAETDAEIKTLLGPERYARYRRAQDPAYKLLTHLAEARDLPPDTAERAYDIKELLESTSRRIATDSSLAPEDRNAALNKAHDEGQAALIKLMGEKNLRLYAARGGYWVR
jgi:hypothetical protein